MRLPWGKIAIGALVVVVSFGGAVGVMSLTSGAGSGKRPVLVEVPPLQPVTRTSVIVTPAAIALTAIRDAMEAKAPRDLTGKRDNPLSQLLTGRRARLDHRTRSARGCRPAGGSASVDGRSTARFARPVRSPPRPATSPGPSAGCSATGSGKACRASPARRSTSVSTSAATSRSRRGRRCCRRGGSSPILPARSSIADASLSILGGQAQRLQRGEAAARSRRERADRGAAGARAR